MRQKTYYEAKDGTLFIPAKCAVAVHHCNNAQEAYNACEKYEKSLFKDVE